MERVGFAYLSLTMISLKRIRELEPKLNNLSDKEVADIRERIYEMAQLAYDSYKEDYDSKFAVGSADVDEEK